VAAMPQASMASPSTALASPWHGRRRLEVRAAEKRARAEKRKALAREREEKK
jgi:hypothetical protein